METALNRTSTSIKPIIFSLLLFTVGFIAFYIIQASADSLRMSGSVETFAKVVSFKKASFIVLIVCSLTASILSGKALSKKKTALFYMVFIAELLTTISLCANCLTFMDSFFKFSFMIKSRSFWIAAFLTALIPWLGIDMAEHRLDWKKDVREELITVVQGVYSFDREEKAAILDRVFERNQTLIGLMYMKGFLMVIMAVASVYFFKRYKQKFRPAATKPVLVTLFLLACISTARILLPNQTFDSGVKILSLNTAVSSLQQLHKEQFQGKILYVDFWGTTCGPCLQEFRNFTAPLKEHYRTRKDISYLYIAQGNEYLWRKQIQKYGVEGEHLFLSEDQYAKLYRDESGDTTVEIIMPRYVILDKRGEIVETDAKRPSDKASLLSQLDKYLEKNNN